MTTTTPYDTAPYGTGTGMLVTAAAGTRLADIEPAELLELLRPAGFLILRGFELDIDGFSQLVRRASSRVTLDPARSFSGDVAQKVDAGFDEVGLHCENGNAPLLPHLTWFFCERAASTGSQTTVCDGHRVWDALPAAARDAFTAHDIVYTRRMAMSEGTTFEALDDGAIVYSFRTPAAHATLWSDRPAFANSILGPSFNYERPRIGFDDGGEIPADILAEVEHVTAELTEDIDWIDGDIALIDNTRVMHGRRAIVDPDRTIYNALSYVAAAAA
jgi:alpha-ketoglutarate-dependent taurine dioxygenase